MQIDSDTMGRVSEERRWRIVALHEDAKWSYNRIALHFHMAKSSVRNQIKRFKATHGVKDRKRSGRPPVMDEEDGNFVSDIARSRPFVTLQELQDELRRQHVHASHSTISRRLHDGGLKSYRPLRFIPLSDAHKTTRVQWCRQHRHWSGLQEWRQVVFSDESRFCVRWTDGRLRVWRQRGSRFAQQNAIQDAERQGSGGSVMVWAAISWHHKSAMVIVDGTMTGRKYRDDVLQEVAIPFGLASIGPGFILQDDNATPHRCALVEEFHESRLDYTHMEWPSRSPDLNPIEHVWDELGRAIARRGIANARDLKLALMEEWHNIPQDRVRRVIRSMRSRCECVIAADGGATRF